MVNIAIMGLGTVGAGVAELLEMNKSLIKKRAGDDIHLKYVLDIRDLSKTPYANCAVDDFETILNDPEVDVIIETIGGATIAGAYTLRALRAGKHVITSNKELVATRGRELLDIAKEKNVNYLFEASVGGGIPLLRPVSECLTANLVHEVYGILNGTTNYILSRMVRDNATFGEALKEAQEKGFAELNPSDDVDGKDTCRKIAILSAMAFRQEMPVDQIPTEGIANICPKDVKIAEAAGYKVKLLGRTIRDDEGKICAYVAPHLVDATHPLASIENETNAVIVRDDLLGEVAFVGPGAGKMPTACSVVADLITVIHHLNYRKRLNWEAWDGAEAGKPEEVPLRYYYRAKDTSEAVAKCFPGCRILHEEGGQVSFITPKMKEFDAEDWAGRLHICSRLCVLN